MHSHRHEKKIVVQKTVKSQNGTLSTQARRILQKKKVINIATYNISTKNSFRPKLSILYSLLWKVGLLIPRSVGKNLTCHSNFLLNVHYLM